MITNAAATAALPGIAEGTLVKVIDAAAGITFLFSAATCSHVTIIDAVASPLALSGIAIGSLVMIVDAVAVTPALFCAAPRAQVMVIDTGATASFLCGGAIGPLVEVVNAIATGGRVTAEHQQHCKNQFHFTLPWVTRKTAWRWPVRFHRSF